MVHLLLTSELSCCCFYYVENHQENVKKPLNCPLFQHRTETAPRQGCGSEVRTKIWTARVVILFRQDISVSRWLDQVLNRKKERKRERDNVRGGFSAADIISSSLGVFVKSLGAIQKIRPQRK